MTEDVKLEKGQVWRAASGDARRIDRVGTGHMSGRMDLWYSVILPDGKIGPARSCFIETWNRWRKASNATLDA